MITPNKEAQTASGVWRKDYIAGLLMFTIGAGAVYQSNSYEIGTLNNIGPGFFPSIIAWLLVGLGIAISLTAKTAKNDGTAKHTMPDLRGTIAIVAGLLAFIVLGEYGGLLPATFALVVIAALGDRENSIVDAVVLAACMCVLAVVVFSWGLKMQFPLFAWG